jgi:hypothetical protein
MDADHTVVYQSRWLRHIRALPDAQFQRREQISGRSSR